MQYPIWQDYFVDLGAPATEGAGVPFDIVNNGNGGVLLVVFSGTAYPRPGETNAVVRINDICADWLNHYFLERPDPQNPASALFLVRVNGTIVKQVQFYNNWSYDPLFDPERDGLNFPIVQTFGPGQYIPVSLYESSVPGTATIYMQNGQVFTTTPVRQRGGDFNEDYNEDFLRSMQYFGDSFVIPLQDFPGAARVDYGGLTWERSKACPRWALYYANAYGGWDALPVEGKATRTDNLTRYTTGQVYDNRTTSARGLRNYVNEVRPAWELWTGWLTAQQSERMHNLLNSPAVYLHDLEDGLVWPVILTNSTTEYKDASRRLVAHGIEVQLAQDRLRR